MPVPTRLANDGWWLCAAEDSSAPAHSPAHFNVGLFSMINSLASTRTLASSLENVPKRLLVAGALTGLADWLFYGHAVGLSLAVFLLCLAACAFITGPLHIGWGRCSIAFGILCLGLAPLIEAANPLSISIGILSAAVTAAILTNPFFLRFADALTAVKAYLIKGPFRIFPDLLSADRNGHQFQALAVWVVPVLVSGIFIALFASANPIIESWVSAIDLKSWLDRVSFARLLFWAIAISFIWPFVYSRWQRRDNGPADEVYEEVAPADANLTSAPNNLFGPAAILRSLILFNALFAVETLLDGIYLWGGVSLPDGLTYAAYAHRGAYPLILTTILAAGFILLATRPGAPSEHSRAIRALVFLWTAQNVLLVLSSMMRLDLYVEIYSLTYWRIAAFIWMALVAVGLILIVARIVLERSNTWLIFANLMATTFMIYLCSFVNFPAFIANYNVAHCKEISGKGVVLDGAYLVSLGPQAIPALDNYIRPRTLGYWPVMLERRDALAATHAKTLDSWRGWSLRGARLQEYLDNNPRDSLISSPASKSS